MPPILMLRQQETLPYPKWFKQAREQLYRLADMPHFDNRSAQAFFRGWLKAMKPGKEETELFQKSMNRWLDISAAMRQVAKENPAKHQAAQRAMRRAEAQPSGKRILKTSMRRAAAARGRAR